MNQNGLEMKNRLKNARGKKKNAKNTLQITRIKPFPNPGGHKDDFTTGNSKFPVGLMTTTGKS
jgi:hypothetical protein